MHKPAPVTVQVADGIALLLLDNPPVNAINDRMLGDLIARSHELHTRDDVRVVVVHGGGKHFAAGADITELETKGLAEIAVSVSRIQAGLGSLAHVGKPTIAAIEGYALGGGLELSLACDFRIVSETARLGLPEIQLGVIPGGGGTQRLARLVGPSIAKNMLYTGRAVAAEEALQIGLADEVVPAGQALARAKDMAAQFASGPALALRAAKLVVDEGLDLSLESGLALERAHFVALFGTEDRVIGMQSFRKQGPGKARFVGR